ncbi:hypothetical protein [Helicobacter sp. T3_23-1056]
MGLGWANPKILPFHCHCERILYKIRVAIYKTKIKKLNNEK